MAIRTRRPLSLAATGCARAAWAARIAVDETALATLATRPTRTARTSKAAARAAFAAALVASAAAGTRATSTSGLRAVWLAWAARAIGIAMAAGTGIDAFGYIPSAECSWIRGAGLLVATRSALARCAWAFRLECALRLLGRGFAGDGEALLARASATTAAIFAHVVEAAQFTAFIGGGDMAAEVCVAGLVAIATDVHGRLGRLALADHRLQRQCRRRAVFQSEFLAQ
jgi:hypothetical protein